MKIVTVARNKESIAKALTDIEAQFPNAAWFTGAKPTEYNPWSYGSNECITLHIEDNVLLWAEELNTNRHPVSGAPCIDGYSGNPWPGTGWAHN